MWVRIPSGATVFAHGSLPSCRFGFVLCFLKTRAMPWQGAGMSEWSRRSTRNRLGSSRAGSNPALSEGCSLSLRHDRVRPRAFLAHAACVAPALCLPRSGAWAMRSPHERMPRWRSRLARRSHNSLVSDPEVTSSILVRGMPLWVTARRDILRVLASMAATAPRDACCWGVRAVKEID